jgi:hypothetical protein
MLGAKDKACLESRRTHKIGNIYMEHICVMDRKTRERGCPFGGRPQPECKQLTVPGGEGQGSQRAIGPSQRELSPAKIPSTREDKITTNMQTRKQEGLMRVQTALGNGADV